MSKKVWEAVETKASVAKTKRERGKGRSEKEERGKGRKTKEKTIEVKRVAEEWKI